MSYRSGTGRSLEIQLRSLQETQEWAAELAHLLTSPDCLLLQGDLGAGKTEFARALIQSLAGPQMQVSSPSFALVQPYEVRLGETQTELWHVDLYRIEHGAELEELALPEAFDQHVVLVEWPERMDPRDLPENRLQLVIAAEAATGYRNVMLTGYGSWAGRLNELSVKGGN